MSLAYIIFIITGISLTHGMTTHLDGFINEKYKTIAFDIGVSSLLALIGLFIRFDYSYSGVVGRLDFSPNYISIFWSALTHFFLFAIVVFVLIQVVKKYLNK